LLTAGLAFAEDNGKDGEYNKLIHYLKLNTEDLAGLEEITEYEPARYEINSFAMISLIVNEDTGNVYKLLEEIKPISYIIRAQVRRAETTYWQELIVISSFTRILSKKRKTPRRTVPNRRTNTSTTDESSFELYELTKEFFELTPYFNERMPVTVLDGELYPRLEKTQDLIELKKKQHLEKSKTVFSFNAANCYIRDVNGKPTYFEAKEGDRLRIQIFRVEPLLTSTEGAKAKCTLPSVNTAGSYTYRRGPFIWPTSTAGTSTRRTSI
jgi:hypothetical protein